jgi:hypothetical protein
MARLRSAAVDALVEAWGQYGGGWPAGDYLCEAEDALNSMSVTFNTIANTIDDAHAQLLSEIKSVVGTVIEVSFLTLLSGGALAEDAIETIATKVEPAFAAIFGALSQTFTDLAAAATVSAAGGALAALDDPNHDVTFRQLFVALSRNSDGTKNT